MGKPQETLAHFDACSFISLNLSTLCY